MDHSLPSLGGLIALRLGQAGLAHINAEGVDAPLSDGVPTVKVPKAEAAKPRRIEITAGE